MLIVGAMTTAGHGLISQPPQGYQYWRFIRVYSNCSHRDEFRTTDIYWNE